MNLNKLMPFITGVLFGIGMVISGMADPAKVIGFLDVSGDWDPSLLFVMGGALFIFTPMYHFIIKPRKQALDKTPICLPINKRIDINLIAGAAIFGLGWGIAGICPGPAISSVSEFNMDIISFVAAMIIGSMIVTKISKRKG
ncbi:MAG: DUF6691 family protein [Vibrio hibernica]